MRRQADAMALRLRRLARALVHDGDAADSLVVDTLAAYDGRTTSLFRLMTTLLDLRRRRQEAQPAQARPAPHGGPVEIAGAFETLPLPEREVLALVVIEQLSYDEAALVLGLRHSELVQRLTRARASLARAVEGERHAVLRVVK